MVDGRFDFIIRERHVAALGRHDTRLALQALNRVCVKRLVTLRDALGPGPSVTDTWGTGDACRMARHAGALVNTRAIDRNSGHLDRLGFRRFVTSDADLSYGLKRTLITRFGHCIALFSDLVGNRACIEISKKNQEQGQNDAQHKEDGKLLINF